MKAAGRRTALYPTYLAPKPGGLWGYRSRSTKTLAASKRRWQIRRSGLLEGPRVGLKPRGSFSSMDVSRSLREGDELSLLSTPHRPYAKLVRGSAAQIPLTIRFRGSYSFERCAAGGSAMIRTRPLRSKDLEQNDGFVVLISRYYPRGIRKKDRPWQAWYPELAPSPGLLRDLKNGKCGKSEFIHRFREEMQGGAANARIRELAASHRSGERVVLVCDHARAVPDDWCHRHALRSIVERFPI